jgi:hypothetical protein
MTNGILNLEGTLETLDPTSRVGLAFAGLNFYFDADKVRENLYFANPWVWFNL